MDRQKRLPAFAVRGPRPNALRRRPIFSNWSALNPHRPSGMLAGMKTLDAVKMAGDFPRFLGRVVSRQESYEIVKEGVPCAYLVPAGKRECNSRELAEDIAGVELAAEDRRALSSAIRRGRKVLKTLNNPWG